MKGFNRSLGFVSAFVLGWSSKVLFVPHPTLAVQRFNHHIESFTYPKLIVDYLTIAQIDFRPDSLPHIFRDKPGHFKDETPQNRQLLKDVANDPKNFVRTDKWGKDWYAKTLPNGKQIWVHVKGGKIVNGGINDNPRSFNSL
jgi:hypothetical protein